MNKEENLTAFDIFKVEDIALTHLKGNEYKLFSFLAKRCNVNDNWWNITNERLEEILNISHATLIKAKHDLLSKGFIINLNKDEKSDGYKTKVSKLSINLKFVLSLHSPLKEYGIETRPNYGIETNLDNVETIPNYGIETIPNTRQETRPNYGIETRLHKEYKEKDNNSLLNNNTSSNTSSSSNNTKLQEEKDNKTKVNLSFKKSTSSITNIGDSAGDIYEKNDVCISSSFGNDGIVPSTTSMNGNKLYRYLWDSTTLIKDSQDKEECTRIKNEMNKYNVSILTPKQKNALTAYLNDVINNKSFPHPSGKSNSECYAIIDGLLNQLYNEKDEDNYRSIVLQLQEAKQYATGLSRKQLHSAKERFDKIDASRTYHAKKLLLEYNQRKQKRIDNVKSTIANLTSILVKDLHLPGLLQLLNTLKSFGDEKLAIETLQKVYTSNKEKWNDFYNSFLVENGYEPFEVVADNTTILPTTELPTTENKDNVFSIEDDEDDVKKPVVFLKLGQDIPIEED